MAKIATIHLLDGDVEGSLKCSLGHWGVVVYKISRELLKEKLAPKKYEKALPRLKQCGIYFLFGKSTNEEYEQGVYVGQAVTRANGRGVLGRVMEHEDIDWKEVVIFVSDNEEEHPLEPGLRYLESRFYDLAKDAGRYDVLNGNNPNPGGFKSNLEDFVDYARTALFALGYNVLEPRPKSAVKSPVTPPRPPDNGLLYMSYKGYNATGKLTDEGFIVMAGSEINPTTTDSCRENVIRVREEYADKINAKNVLTSDITLGSPSLAAGFVCGSKRNGRTDWHDSQGRTLDELEKMTNSPFNPSEKLDKLRLRG